MAKEVIDITIVPTWRPEEWIAQGKRYPPVPDVPLAVLWIDINLFRGASGYQKSPQNLQDAPSSLFG